MHTRFSIVLFPLVLLVAGCGSGNDPSSQMLSGHLTLDGKPVANATVVAALGDKEVSGPSNDQGVYKIYSPPKGKLQFKIYSVPPPPPGTPAPPPIPGMAAIPYKYQKLGNELSFEYKGGKQTYDIPLNP